MVLDASGPMVLDASGYAPTFVYMPGKIDLDVEAGGFDAVMGLKYPKDKSGREIETHIQPI